MFEIRVKESFAAAHNLAGYRGKCERLHGHNWIVEAVYIYTALDRSGMAVDFKIARSLLRSALEDLDHSYLNKVPALKGINPTSEHIARFIFKRIHKKNRHIRSISVWENDHSRATYREGPHEI